MRELFCAKPAHLLLENNQGTHIFVGWISAGCCSDSLQTEFPPSSLHSPLLKKVLKKKPKINSCNCFHSVEMHISKGNVLLNKLQRIGELNLIKWLKTVNGMEPQVI